MTISDVFRKFADEGDNPVNNPNIFNIEGNHMLSPDLQHLVARSTTRDKRKCVENSSLSRPGSVIVFTIPEIICLFPCKTKPLSYKHLRVVSV